MRIIFCLIFLCILQAQALGLSDNITHIVDHSKSGKTLILDLGSSRGFKTRESAYLIKPIYNKKRKRKYYTPVAKMKLVKQSSRSSVWFVTKKYTSFSAKDSSSFLLFTQTDMLNGRKKLKLRRKKAVISQKSPKQVSKALGYKSFGLKNESKNYTAQDLDQRDSLDTQADFDLVDIDMWEKRYSDKYSKPLVRSIDKNSFLEKKDLNTFDKMIHSFLKRSNSTDFGNKDFREGVLADNYSDQIAYEKSIKDKNLARVAQEYSKKGAAWSDELSDEELSRVLYKVGVLKERQRKDNVSAHDFSHQVYVAASLGYTNNQNSDYQAMDGSKFALGLNFESYILKRFRDLNRYTFEGGLRYSVDHIDVGSTNALLKEISLSAHMNWYPFHLANTLSRNIIFLSLGIRAGFSSAVTDSEVGQYQSLVFPAFRLGVKYNFEDSFSMRLVASYEPTTAGQISAKQGTLLPEKISYNDGKLSVSLGKFF